MSSCDESLNSLLVGLNKLHIISTVPLKISDYVNGQFKYKEDRILTIML